MNLNLLSLLAVSFFLGASCAVVALAWLDYRAAVRRNPFKREKFDRHMLRNILEKLK